MKKILVILLLLTPFVATNDYGVGVSISFMSPEIAKEKYDQFVNDFKEKYETDKWDNKLKSYSDNPDTLINHIVSGNLSSFVKSYNDSIDNEFGIYFSKIVLDDKEKELAKSSLNAILGLKLITNLGNIGTIKVICENKVESKVSIIYRDEQNTSLIEEKRKEDL